MHNDIFRNIGAHGWGMFYWTIIVFAIFGLIFWLVQRKNRSEKDKKSETPLEVLKRRYASGEISEKEYEQMKAKLEDSEKKS